jgi:hypothetical protein
MRVGKMPGTAIMIAPAPRNFAHAFARRGLTAGQRAGKPCGDIRLGLIFKVQYRTNRRGRHGGATRATC